LRNDAIGRNAAAPFHIFIIEKGAAVLAIAPGGRLPAATATRSG